MLVDLLLWSTSTSKVDCLWFTNGFISTKPSLLVEIRFNLTFIHWLIIAHMTFFIGRIISIDIVLIEVWPFNALVFLGVDTCWYSLTLVDEYWLKRSNGGLLMYVGFNEVSFTNTNSLGPQLYLLPQIFLQFNHTSPSYLQLQFNPHKLKLSLQRWYLIIKYCSHTEVLLIRGLLSRGKYYLLHGK